MGNCSKKITILHPSQKMSRNILKVPDDKKLVERAAINLMKK